MRYWAEWREWWKNATLWRRTWPLAVAAGYTLALLHAGDLKQDRILANLIFAGVLYAGPAGERAFGFVFPFLLTSAMYDSQRYVADWLRGPIHFREPYDFDLRFFGIRTSHGVLTPNEWWELHTHPMLDLLTGLAYLVFIGEYVLVSIYFYFRAERTNRAGWAFFWVSALGISTYYWYAAAPPWYVAAHGFGPALAGVKASPAGCARFDQLLGTGVFEGMYALSTDVFGSIPSLHVAYPLMAACAAFQYRKLRVLTVGFYLLMCFAAVYLNHHYVLDLIWGSAYGLLVFGAVTWVLARRKAQILPR